MSVPADARGASTAPEAASVARETRAQLAYAIPVSVSSLCNRARDVVSLAFVGAERDVGALAGASLASTFANVTGNAIVVGLASATVTLAGQAFGAGARERCGACAQRAALATLATCAVIASFWPMLDVLAVKLGQDGEIARRARSYVLGLRPGLFAYGLNVTTQSYLQAIGMTRPQAANGIVATALHPFTCLMFKRLGFGFVGPAYATSVSTTLVLALNVTYLAARRRPGIFRERDETTAKKRDECWVGFDAKEMFDVEGLKAFFRLGIPGVIVMMEWWASEFAIAMAGLLPNPKVAVSAMSIYQVTNAFAFMIAVGFGASAATRVAHEVGAGDAAAASLAASVALRLIVGVELCVSLVVFLARESWPSVFTSDAEVRSTVSRLMVPLAVYVFFDGLCCVSTSVLRGAGRQAFAAPIVLVSYYVIGLPLSAFLAFAKASPTAKHRVVGLALGGVAGTAAHAGFMTRVALRLDWRRELVRAREALARKAHSHELSSSDDIAYEPLAPDVNNDAAK